MSTPAPVSSRGIEAAPPAPSPTVASTSFHAGLGPRRSRRAGWWVVGGLTVVLGAALGWQQLQQMTLRLELGLAREQLRELGLLRAENAALRQKQTSPEELLMLRADRVALERMRTELDQIKRAAESNRNRSATAAAPAKHSPPPPVRSVLEMRNVGTATPQAAGETFVWSLQHGDIDAAAGLIRLMPDARARMEAILASLPPAYRAQYGTPERFLAFVLAGSGGVAALRVLGESVQGDRAVQRIEVQVGDGRTRQDSILFQREPSGWHRVITRRTVEMVAAYLSERPPTAGK